MARQEVEKTDAMRLLDQRRVTYEALTYDPGFTSPPNPLSVAERGDRHEGG
jgi:hypothetical protein